jgi:hypothetical protein
MPETPVTHCVLLWARPGQENALTSYEDRVLAPGQPTATRPASTRTVSIPRTMPAMSAGAI